jgi:hypothetical protein
LWKQTPADSRVNAKRGKRLGFVRSGTGAE